MRAAAHRSYSGFTLLELLVAIAVFAIMSIMAYGGLRTVLETRQLTDVAATRLAELQFMMLRLGRDLEHAVPRGIRGAYGEKQAALLAAEYGEPQLEFTRSGRRNPAGLARSQLQRVAYDLQDNILYRVTWPVLDRAPNTEPIRTPLVNQVESLSARFLDQDNEWHVTWPPPEDESADPSLPRAVELTLELEDWGRITRLFAIAGGV